MSFTSFSEEVKVWLWRNNWVLWKKLRGKSWTEPREEFKLRDISFCISYPKCQEKKYCVIVDNIMFFSLKFKPTGRSAWWLQYNSDEVLFRWTAVLFSALLLRDYLQRNLICKIKWLRLSLQGDRYARSYNFNNPFGWSCFIYEKRTRPLKKEAN